MKKSSPIPGKLTNTALFIFAFAFLACIAGIVLGFIVDASPNKKVYAEVFVAFAGFMVGGIISMLGFVISAIALAREKKLAKGIAALILNGMIAVPMTMYIARSYADNRARQEERVIRENRLRIDVKESAPGVNCETLYGLDGIVTKGRYGMKIEARDVCLRHLLDRIEQFQSKPDFRYEIKVEGPINYRLTLNYPDMDPLTTLRRIADYLPGWWEVDYRQKREVEITENGSIITKTVVLRRKASE